MNPDDLIVLSTTQSLSEQWCERIEKHLRSKLGVSNKILVLTDGLQFSIVPMSEAGGE